MALSQKHIFELIRSIRFVDIITVFDGVPYSVKVTSFLKENENSIEFHIPKRCEQILGSIDSGQSILMKYSTEYADVSSEWCVDAPKDKRISTIIGVEIHIRSKPENLNQEALVKHLEDTAEQSKERIGDTFTVGQLDTDYFLGALQQTVGYRVDLGVSDIQTVENIIDYRSRDDKLRSIDALNDLSKAQPSNKFSVAADLLDSLLQED